MVTFVFSHKTQADAISSAEYLHKAMQGDKAYVNGDICICVSTIDSNTKQPTCEDGNLDYAFNGKVLHHCVLLDVGTIDNPVEPIVMVLDHPLDDKYNSTYVHKTYGLDEID